MAQAVLNVRINDEFDHSQDFSAQVESITKSTLLSLFSSQCLDWLQVEIVVQMKEVEVLAMDQEVELSQIIQYY